MLQSGQSQLNHQMEASLHVHKRFEFDFQYQSEQTKAHLMYRFLACLIDAASLLLQSYKLRYRPVRYQSGFQRHHHASNHESRESLRQLLDVPTSEMDPSLLCFGFDSISRANVAGQAVILLVNDQSPQYVQSRSFREEY